MPAALIELFDAWKVYDAGDAEVAALRGVSIAIRAGEFVAVTGASGSGKSTFLHIVGCLDRLTRGSYAFEGRPADSLSRAQLASLRNRRIGFVFQSFNLLPRTSVLENVALPLKYQGVSRGERRRRALAMLERVGLAQRVHHHPNQLSGGQQQRVAVARALVTQPAVVMADEPTGNLDSRTSHEVMSLFQEMNRERGVCIILVTHETDIAAYAGRQVVFLDGQVQRDEPTAARGGPHAAAQTGAGQSLAAAPLAGQSGRAAE